MSLFVELPIVLIYVLISLLITIKCWLTSLIMLVHPVYKDLSSDIILITGAGHGIGQNLCLGLAPYCSKIVAVDINPKGLESTKKLYDQLQLKHKARLFTFVCDLRSTNEIDTLTKNIMQDVGIVTVCVNNAGIVNGKYLLDVSYEEFSNVLKVNVLAHFYLIQKLLPNMLGESFSRYAKLKCLTNTSSRDPNVYVDPSCATKSARGHIVCINSLAGCVPAPGLSDYCASKAAAVLLAEGLREELDCAGLSSDIKVTNVMPYFVDTGMFHGSKNKYNSLMPMQTVQGACDQIVEAIRLEKTDVFVSPRFALFPLAKHILPYPALNYLYKMVGSHEVMPTFQGKSDNYHSSPDHAGMNGKSSRNLRKSD